MKLFDWLRKRKNRPIVCAGTFFEHCEHLVAATYVTRDDWCERRDTKALEWECCRCGHKDVQTKLTHTQLLFYAPMWRKSKESAE